MRLWLWGRKDAPIECSDGVCPAPSTEAMQAVEDSKLVLETARYRWTRVLDVAARAESASQEAKSQRDQNHFGEIAWGALHASRGRA